MTLAT